MRQTTGGGPTLGQSSRTIRGDMGAVDETPTAEAADQAIIRTIDLTKVYPGADFRPSTGLNLSVQAGRDLRPPRPERCRQDDDRRHADDSCASRTSGERVRRRYRRGRSSRRRRSSSIGVVSQQNTLDRQLNGVGEPLLPRAVLRDARPRSRLPPPTSCSPSSTSTKWARSRSSRSSGGMAQRLMVARSILHRPAVLFLDEPTPGLDPQSRLALWDVLGELHARRARPSCSRPTTWRKPTSSATGSRSWTTAGSSPSTRRRR